MYAVCTMYINVNKLITTLCATIHLFIKNFGRENLYWPSNREYTSGHPVAVSERFKPIL